ncbi:MAG TPA: TraR/DksA C4-type zinc finger protein [Actinomycetota bacterium]|nr:TraR/DksA C4-type zinc finger protein [Actinomycetota bacterium]
MDPGPLLRKRRQRISEELESLTRAPEAGTNLSFGKRIGDGTTEAVERIATTATARSLTASLAEVDRALEKLEEGTYGFCDECGDEIPPSRLEAKPAATRCVRHT